MNSKQLSLALTMLVFLNACGTAGQTRLQQQGMTPALSDDLSRSMTEKLPDEITEQRIDQSYPRIMALKSRLAAGG